MRRAGPSDAARRERPLANMTPRLGFGTPTTSGMRPLVLLLLGLGFGFWIGKKLCEKYKSWKKKWEQRPPSLCLEGKMPPPPKTQRWSVRLYYFCPYRGVVLFHLSFFRCLFLVFALSSFVRWYRLGWPRPRRFQTQQDVPLRPEDHRHTAALGEAGRRGATGKKIGDSEWPRSNSRLLDCLIFNVPSSSSGL